MTALVGFPLGTLYTITGISQAYPGTVTLSSVALPNSFAVALGMTVTISKVIGMAQVNGGSYIIGNFNAEAMTFDMFSTSFQPIDTRSFAAYVGGGEMNIVSYPPSAGEPPGLMYNNQ